MHKWFGVCVLVSVSSLVQGESIKDKQVASNGVLIEVVKNEQGGRTEYSSPAVEIRSDVNGFFMVVAQTENGTTGPTKVIGDVFYDGDWRDYDRVLFRDGTQAAAKFGDHKVISCSSSRGNACSLSEGFEIRLTRQQVHDYDDDGVLQVQLQSPQSNSVVLRIPENYFDAVSEVSGNKFMDPRPAT